MNQSITVDGIIRKINNGSDDNRSLAETFIDAIRDYQLSDSQALFLFAQVKKSMRNCMATASAGKRQSCWALPPC